MNTTELKQYIDALTPDERGWMASYLLAQRGSSSALEFREEELAELDRRRAEMEVGINRVSQAEVEARLTSS